MLTTANYTDRDGAVEMMKYYSSSTERLSRLQKVLADGGYTGATFANIIKLITGAEVEVVKRNELHNFMVIPKRWVVERTFGWLDKYRRLWKNCERKLHNTYQMVTIAFIRLLVKRY